MAGGVSAGFRRPYGSVQRACNVELNSQEHDSLLQVTSRVCKTNIETLFLERAWAGDCCYEWSGGQRCQRGVHQPAGNTTPGGALKPAGSTDNLGCLYVLENSRSGGGAELPGKGDEDRVSISRRPRDFPDIRKIVQIE